MDKKLKRNDQVALANIYVDFLKSGSDTKFNSDII